MNTVELLSYSVDTAFGILGMVTADLTQEMADWRPPGKTSSITAFRLKSYQFLITSINIELIKIEIRKVLNGEAETLDHK